MSPERYENLLQCVAPLLKARQCRTRESISPAERITLTLRYLASGDSQPSLAFNFRLGRTTVSTIIQETCEAMWIALSQDFVIAPQSEQDWKEISAKFYEEWDFPNCLGALDGKHVAIECPGFSGSEYYNYKGFFSIVLMAICDARYCFTIVDIGNFGRDNDAQIFNSSEMGKAFISGNMSVPSQTVVEGFTLPYVLVSDEIFGLKTWLMKPYPGKDLNEEQRIFNYRLSRARRTIENSFGILAARWRIFRRPIKASPETVDNIIKACIGLHNYLRLTENARYTPMGFIDSEDSSGNVVLGDWRTIVHGEQGALHNTSTGRAFNSTSLSAKGTRDTFMKFFNSTKGSLSWQKSHINSTGGP